MYDDLNTLIALYAHRLLLFSSQLERAVLPASSAEVEAAADSWAGGRPRHRSSRAPDGEL